MKPCTEEELLEALNRLGSELEHVIDKWYLYRKGSPRYPPKKGIIKGTQNVSCQTRRGIRSSFLSIEETGYFSPCFCIMEIEHDYLLISQHEHRNAFFYWDKVKSIDDMAKRILRTLRRRLNLSMVF
jgi:hypothetical protein